MARCTYFFAGSPYHRTDGCHIRALETLEFLSTVFKDIRFYSFADHPVWPWLPAHEQEAGKTGTITLHLEPLTPARRWLTRLKNTACALVPAAAAKIASARPMTSPQWQAAIDQANVLFLNYLDAFTQIPWWPKDVRTIVDTHDIGFLAYAQRTQCDLHRLDVLARLRKEIGLSACAAELIAISRKEYWLLQDFCPTARVSYLPPKFVAHPAPAGAEAAGEPALLFVGSGNAKNVAGLTQLLEEMTRWPRQPEFKIAGGICNALPERTRNRASAFAQFLGFVDDLSGLYAQPCLALCPVTGTGTNIKILEALAHGVPVFTTEEATRALPGGYEHCVFDLNWPTVKLFLEDRSRLEAARHAAIGYVTGARFSEPWARFRATLAERI